MFWNKNLTKNTQSQLQYQKQNKRLIWLSALYAHITTLVLLIIILIVMILILFTLPWCEISWTNCIKEKKSVGHFTTSNYQRWESHFLAYQIGFSNDLPVLEYLILHRGVWLSRFKWRHISWRYGIFYEWMLLSNEVIENLWMNA